MGASLRLHQALLIVFLYQISFLQVAHAQDEADKNESKLIRAPEYYQYWNPYRRVLSQRGELHTFIGKVYYEVNYNKDDRIKTVTKFGKMDRPKKHIVFYGQDLVLDLSTKLNSIPMEGLQG